VAPVEHREQVVGDFSLEEYLELQTFVFRIGRALSEVLPTERLYLLSLGSQQGNRHVHWHVASLPPGTAFEDQQLAALTAEHRGYLDIPEEARDEFSERLRMALGDSEMQ
jgi:diadenosine tetraphosphate (Ap4A) HIT family hydrolase